VSSFAGDGDEVRRQLVPIIREACDKDAEAAAHIERALEKAV
jgi:hypothetical protein